MFPAQLTQQTRGEQWQAGRQPVPAPLSLQPAHPHHSHLTTVEVTKTLITILSWQLTTQPHAHAPKI